MKLRIAALLAASLLLSGCSDMDLSDMFNFPGDDQAQPTAQPAAVAAVAPAPGPDRFCQGVAQQEATSNDFDAPTQLRMAQKSYAQCVALHGGN